MSISLAVKHSAHCVIGKKQALSGAYGKWRMQIGELSSESKKHL